MAAPLITAGPREAPSPAVAPPPGNPRFGLFDSLRAIAVLAILTFHAASVTGALADPVTGPVVSVFGSLGPALFFVISGFLLYRPFVVARVAGDPAPGTARYARRRALRILPAYWTALTVLALFPGIVGVFSGDWWRYYLFLQSYSARTFGGGIPVAWTLCVEVAFYIMLPVWALAIRLATRGRGATAGWRWELGALALLAATGVGFQLAAARQVVPYLVSESIAGQSTWLAFGMALAVLSVAAQRAPRAPWLARVVTRHAGLCWIGAVGALAALAAVTPADGIFAVAARLAVKQPVGATLRNIALSAILLALLVLPAVFGQRAGGVPRRVLAWAPLAFLGLISYGVYLWHLTLLELLGLSADPTHFSAAGLGLTTSLHHGTTLVLLGLTLAASMAVATVSYHAVELPFLRLKER